MTKLNPIIIVIFATILSSATPNKFTFDIPVAPNHTVSLIDEGSPGIGHNGLSCLRSGASIVRLSHGIAKRIDFKKEITTSINRDLFDGAGWDGSWDQSLMVDTAIVFDKVGIAYTIIVPRYSNLKTAVLLASSDACQSWNATPLTGRNATIEKPGPFTDRNRPPTVLSYENYGSITGHNLWIDLFRRSKDGRLLRLHPRPLLVGDNSLLVANHSGGGNSSLTINGRIIVAFPVRDKQMQGTLSVARELNLTTLNWTGPTSPIGRSTTQGAQDPHDLPAIARLPSGNIIAVIGSHHTQFQLFESRAINTIGQGWGAAQRLGDPTRGKAFSEYSYVSLNVARNGTINIFARAEGTGKYSLVQLRRSKGSNNWNWPDGAPHRIITQPQRIAYSAWRQQVSEAPDGTLYLHFAYFPNKFNDEEARALGLLESKRMDCVRGRCWYPNAPTLSPRTLVSRDDGITWQ